MQRACRFYFTSDLDPPMSRTIVAISELVQGSLSGNAELNINGLAEISRAQADELTFIGDQRWAGKWTESKAGAALVNHDIKLDDREGTAVIRVDNADLAMAQVLELFDTPPAPANDGIHPSAIIDASAKIGSGVNIGANVSVGANTIIGDNCNIFAGCQIACDCTIGENTRLLPNVCVYADCHIGARCIIHANTTIGADGFGYRPSDTGIVKIPHIGSVEIGNDVEIGANSCVDRGKFGPTTVGHGSKIDNLVQIAHNAQVGNHVIIAGCTAVAGSSSVGDGTLVGGKVAISDHVHIGKGCKIAGSAAVIDDMPDGQAWAGMPAKPIKQALKEELVIRKLPAFFKQAKKAGLLD